MKAFKEFIQHNEAARLAAASAATTAEEHSYEEAATLIQDFFQHFRISYFFRRNQNMPPPYYDDKEENATDLLNIFLTNMMMKQAIKNGDAVGIRALKLALIPFFLAKNDKQTSKYALHLFKEHIDFVGADSLTKERLDRYATINISGIPGTNKPHDMTLENLNMPSKDIIKGMKREIEPIELEKKVLASNINNMMVSLDKEVNGIDGAKGGGHADLKLSEEQIEDIDEEVERADAFGRSKKVVFKQRMRGMWSGGESGGRLCDANIVRFLQRNRFNYERSRLRRRF